jgi:hypothetical protein
VVDRPEPGPGDDEQRKAQLRREIADRPGLADRNEQAAGPLDEDELVARRDVAHVLDDRVELDRHALEPCSHERGKRFAEAPRRDLLGPLDEAGQAPEHHGVAARILRERSALHRLHDPDRHAARREREGQAGRDDRLADARVGGGDEEPARAGHEAVTAPIA